MDRRPRVFVRLANQEAFSGVAAYLSRLGCDTVRRSPGMNVTDVLDLLRSVELILWVAEETVFSPQLGDDEALAAVTRGTPCVVISVDGTGYVPPELARKKILNPKGAAFHFLFDASQDLPELSEAIRYYAKAQPNGSESNRSVIPSTFKKLVVGGFRCFRTTQEVDFSRRWNVFLGDNGTGKTTLLRLLARLAGSHHETFVPEGQGRDCWALIGLDEGPPWEAVLQIDRRAFAPICFGYGAWRGTRAPRREHEVGDHCLSLWDEEWDLPNPEDWLLKVDHTAKASGDHSKIKKALGLVTAGLLPEVQSLEIKPVNGDMAVVAHTMRGERPLRDLSYGYRSSLTWVMDLAGRMFDLFGPEDPFNQEVVILVDEIDLHLHPKWQKQLIRTLNDTFKKAQFIVTAHSPLIVQAAPDANVILLKWEGDQVIIRNDLDYVRDWRVDQILASELFEGQPVHSNRIESILHQRKNLLLKNNRTPEEEAEIERLEAELDSVDTQALPQDPIESALIKELADRIRKESPAA